VDALQPRRMWCAMPLRVDFDDDGRPLFVRTKQPQLWLIDYKAPSQVDTAARIAMQYAAQLHQGAILCAEHGVDLDGMMLSQFDWANWSLKDDYVEWDESLALSLIDAGDFYWGYAHEAAGAAIHRAPLHGGRR